MSIQNLRGNYCAYDGFLCMNRAVGVMETGSKILVVEDNPLVSGVIKSLLNHAHFDVIVTENGKEALDVLHTHAIDLILCDVMMPKMDGYELFESIKDSQNLNHIPFVFLTALDEKSERAKGAEIGADDYLVKPFEAEELLAVVRGKLKRASNNKHQYDSYRKRVLHTLSHEFRTPLVAINTGTELLINQSKSNETEKKTIQLLEAIQRSGERLEKLVTDFMLMQQLEAGVAEKMYTERRKPVTLSALISGTLNKFLPILKENKFSVGMSGASGNVTVIAYEPHIFDALGRILSNSIKFSNSTKEIVITTEEEEEYGVISVYDKGVGISPAMIEQALSSFSQIDRDKKEQQGGGLGLPIAHRYIQLHKGILELKRRDDGGTVVRLKLPKTV